jgi:uncharacterized protein YbcI
MMTQDEIESAISDCMRCFEMEFTGRTPSGLRTYLLEDLIVVRINGVLTAAEEHLIKMLPHGKGADLLKQVRCHLVEVARPAIDAMIRGVTGVGVVSLHHDVSTQTGEEIIVFTLDHSPSYTNRGTPTGVARGKLARSQSKIPANILPSRLAGIGSDQRQRETAPAQTLKSTED